MHRKSKPLEIAVYQDVLCAWCYVLDARLEALRSELGAMVRFRPRPYPLRIQEGAASRSEAEEWRAEIGRARREPEGSALTDALWSEADPPRSSVPALAALEAAGLQGPEARDALYKRLQQAALEQGINVTRSDTLLELAAGLGLEMNRFSAAFQSESTSRLVLEEQQLARRRGVEGVPTLVVGGRWMISGLREAHEYREHIVACIEKQDRKIHTPEGRVLH